MLHGLQAQQGLSYTDIERQASAFRMWAGLDPFETLPAMSLFDALDSYQVAVGDDEILDVVTGVQHLDPDVQGQIFYNPHHDRMELELTTAIFEALAEDAPHARFCFAHELGHLVLHSALARILALSTEEARVALMRSSNHQPYEDTEWQANAFGGALLMPFLAVHALQTKHTDPHSLKAALMEQFGVSPKAVDVRLKVIRERHQRFEVFLK